MTVARNLRKAFYVPVVAALLVALTLTCPAADHAVTERIVVDRHTGLAIGGFDPVAYFVEAEAVLGKGDFEYALADTVWRFRNEGNRAAFVDNPEIYMPRFGGYDPVAVARDEPARRVIGEETFDRFHPIARVRVHEVGNRFLPEEISREDDVAGQGHPHPA